MLLERYNNKPIADPALPDYGLMVTGIMSLYPVDTAVEPRSYISMLSNPLRWYRWYMGAVQERTCGDYHNFQVSCISRYSNLIYATRIVEEAFRRDDKVKYI